MTHPAINDDVAARLRAGPADGPTAEPTPAPRSSPASGPSEGKWSAAALKARARQAATPVIDKVRHELGTAAEQEQAELRGEVAELKELLLRTRAEHGAEIAALHEELAASRRP